MSTYDIQERTEKASTTSSEEDEEELEDGGTCLPCFITCFVTKWIYHYSTSDSLIGAITNLCNATIGAGILFLPSVILSTGFVVGFTLFMFGGLIEGITLFLLYKSYDKLKTIDKSIKDYEQIGRYCFGSNNLLGKSMSYLIQFTVFILNLGGTIAFSIIISDSLQFIRDKNPLFHAIILAIVLGIATGISTFPRISSLRFTSYISMIVYFIFLILVIVSYFTKTTESLGPYRMWPSNGINVVSNMGIIIFSFSCHTVLCPIISQFEEKNQWKVGSFGVFGSITIDYLFYSLIGLFGYLCFADYTEGDLILSFTDYGENVVISAILTALMGTSVFASYPLCIYIARYTINNLVYDGYKDFLVCSRFVFNRVKKKKEEEELLENEELVNGKDEQKEEKEEEEEEEEDKMNTCQNIVLTVVSSITITTISYLFALFFPEANVVFGLVGSTGAIFTVYIFPCLFYLIIYHEEMPRWYDLRRIGVILIGVLGTIFGVFVTISSVISLF